MSETHLDTRPARGDLTSRECCKLFSAALAGAVATGLPVAVIRTLFTIAHCAACGVQDSDQFDQVLKSVLQLNEHELGPADAVRLSCVSVMLSSVLGGIQEQAAPEASETALHWISEQGDPFWDALTQQTEQAREQLGIK